MGQVLRVRPGDPRTQHSAGKVMPGWGVAMEALGSISSLEVLGIGTLAAVQMPGSADDQAAHRAMLRSRSLALGPQVHLGEGKVPLGLVRDVCTGNIRPRPR